MEPELNEKRPLHGENGRAMETTARATVLESATA